MDLYADSIRGLPDEEKLLLVQQIWDDLSNSEHLPLPEWAIAEAKRRRDEMVADPALGKSHEEVIRRLREWRDE